MILGRGTARTDEEIAADYRQTLEQSGHIRTGTQLFSLLLKVPQVMIRRIGKPIAQWTDEDLLTLYQARTKSLRYG